MNSTRGKRERIGRILRMHANKREELTEADAGNIYAAVGLRDTRTGDTLCDEKQADRPREDDLPGARHLDRRSSRRPRPTSRSSASRSQKLATEDPSFRVHTDEESGQTIISGMGELHLEIIVDRLTREFKVECERRQARGRVPRGDREEASTCEYKYAKQSGGRGQYGHVLMEIEPGERGAGFVFENDIVGGVIPKEFIPAIEKGVKEAMDRGVLAGYPDGRREGRALRRQLPRRRLERGRRSRSPRRWPSRTAPSARVSTCSSRSWRTKSSSPSSTWATSSATSTRVAARSSA